MKLAILASAAVIALVVALQPATAVDDAPNARVQLIEVEQQTPYLESFAGVTAGHRDDVDRPPRRRHHVLEPGVRPVRQPQRRWQPGDVPDRGRGR